MTKRKTISKRVRFAVLHRDGFRCRYCGSGGEGITLHLDHSLAVANGGSNDIENLVTACADCNLGKGVTRIQNQPGGSTLVKCPFAEGWPFDIEDPVYFANGSWVVTAYGLESLLTYYPIEASRLGALRNGSSDWLLHLAEKEDIAERYEELVAAFRKALAHHRTAYTFNLEASIAEGRNDAAETNRWIQK